MLVTPWNVRKQKQEHMMPINVQTLSHAPPMFCAAMMSVFEMFNAMEDAFRQEACKLVEYMHCPEGVSHGI